ncbi:ribose-phosphate pyrophosphokinase [Candidatus Poribacteria bacterium]|nr:ribose-phosphate pyrophosphokinase [Candidatus Poribacteria bacterium]
MCDILNIPLGKVSISKFSNENTFVQVQESVREMDVFVIQSLYPHPNESLVELMLLCDALRSASAKRITAVIPHYSYARSDKKDMPRISIAARLIADVLVTSGANRFLTMTLHSEQVHGFFSVPTDHLQGAPVICEYLKDNMDLSNAMALFDMGQDKRGGRYAERLGIPIAVLDKERVDDTRVRIKFMIGDVKDKDIIIFDDEISRGTSLVATVDAIKDKGVKSVWAACTHGLFCGPAIQLIRESPIEKVITTNTVDIPMDKRIDKIEVLSVAKVFAKAIKRIHLGQSVSGLFR